jgi:hypothetical protein
MPNHRVRNAVALVGIALGLMIVPGLARAAAVAIPDYGGCYNQHLAGNSNAFFQCTGAIINVAYEEACHHDPDPGGAQYWFGTLYFGSPDFASYQANYLRLVGELEAACPGP